MRVSAFARWPRFCEILFRNQNSFPRRGEGNLHEYLLLGAALVASLATGPALAGNIVLTGHDNDYHVATDASSGGGGVTGERGPRSRGRAELRAERLDPAGAVLRLRIAADP